MEKQIQVNPNTGEVNKLSSSFAYRNIKKDYSIPETSSTISKQYHLELGAKNELLIIEDRDIDWFEIAQKDVENVGISAVLRDVQRGLVDVNSLMTTDEGIDLSGLNVKDPQSVKDGISSISENEAKLKKLASQLGVSTDTLISKILDGSFSELIQEKSKLEVKEGGNE